ncbi:MAG: ABC transporter substrate-binding protein [Thermoleophilum sp.]|nr:ABC transporter substrate-binding protein [Thermoleophilum sp.]
MKRPRHFLYALVMALVVALTAAACGREEETSPGISDNEIKIGGSYPFSGPASAYRTIADGVRAYFAKVNAEGGVDGRRIRFITYDDAYEPQRALQNARRLIERDRVFALFNTLGTANNVAIWDYTNREKVPQLFVATGASIFGADPDKHPYTMGWQPDYVTESQAYAEYLKRTKPRARVAVLYQNDEFGKNLLGGFERAIRGSGIRIVARESYEVTDPSIATQMRRLATSGADTFLDITTPRFSAQAIVGVARSGWRPLHILNSVGASKRLVFQPVGLKPATGIVSAAYFKDPEDPQWANDAAMREYKAAMRRYAPRTDPNDTFATYGWAVAQTLVETLKKMEDPNRDSLMNAARSLDLEIPILLPGVRVKTSESDYYPIETVQLMRFDGQRWRLLDLRYTARR